jgi:hypothetical protein
MPRRRHPFAPFVGGTLKPIPDLPEATTLRELGLSFAEDELTLIRTAMALHKESRQPQLTDAGWKVIGLALNVGEARAKQHADGVVHSRGPYGQTIARFLRATGFAFINKGVRWALRQRIDHMEDVDAWLDSLIPSRRAHLNNPIDVWDQYCEDQRTPKSQTKPRPLTSRQRRDHVNLLDELTAVQDALEALEVRYGMLDATMLDILAPIPPETLKRYPDDLLRRIFARLPEQVQDELHPRLFPPGA